MASEEEVYNKLRLISQQRNLIQEWVCETMGTDHKGKTMTHV